MMKGINKNILISRKGCLNLHFALI